jgi:zinc transporter, ZIP family
MAHSCLNWFWYSSLLVREESQLLLDGHLKWSDLLPLSFLPTHLLTALAAGMMVAASYSLACEGYGTSPITTPDASVSLYFLSHPLYRVLLGFLLGLLFILFTKHLLSDYQDLNICSLTGSDAHKVLLIMLVMTLHSVSEGIGIGVSFGGPHGPSLGKFISFSLALHNIPEGLAIALIFTSRGISSLRTTLFCVLSSLPQPLMALPAFYFIEKFLPILPVGLGFAAGAMLYVALFELIPEAIEDCRLLCTLLISLTSFLLMICAQEYAHQALVTGGGEGSEV